ncbi:MAG: hypothetical protein JSW73_01615 [Candidatus Woesearchaeota archaeon]|nr:MAG: hypothetical protein JSW73_01615 [Candidatus Woesearchaeota archaeon]
MEPIIKTGVILDKKNIQLYSVIHGPTMTDAIENFLHTYNPERIFCEANENGEYSQDGELIVSYSKNNKKELIYIGYDFLKNVQTLSKENPVGGIICLTNKLIQDNILVNPTVSNDEIKSKLGALLSGVESYLLRESNDDIAIEVMEYYKNNLYDNLSELRGIINSKEENADVRVMFKSSEAKLLKFYKDLLDLSNEQVWNKIEPNLNSKKSAIFVGFMHAPYIKEKLSEKLS